MSDRTEERSASQSVSFTIARTVGRLAAIILVGMILGGVFMHRPDPPLKYRGPDGRLYESSEDLVRAVEKTHPNVMESLKQIIQAAESDDSADQPADAQRVTNESN